MVVLGISLGTRTSGIAVLHHKELVVSRTIAARSPETDTHFSVIAHYVRQYRVAVIIVKLPPITHITERFNKMLKEFVALFQYHGCMVQYTSQAEIKRAVPAIKNGNDLIAHTASLYPILLPEQQKEVANRNSYHNKMFEAVLIAHLGSQDNYHPPN